MGSYFSSFILLALCASCTVYAIPIPEASAVSAGFLEAPTGDTHMSAAEKRELEDITQDGGQHSEVPRLIMTLINKNAMLTEDKRSQPGSISRPESQHSSFARGYPHTRFHHERHRQRRRHELIQQRIRAERAKLDQ